MKRHEWFRNRRWTLEIEAGFERRLARARKRGRGQYVHIQSHPLWEAAANPEEAPELRAAAMALFGRVVRGHPDDLRVGNSYEYKARRLGMPGDPRGALENYRHAAGRFRQRPGMGNWGWLEFPFLAARQGFSEHHDEALSLLDEFTEETLPFPILKFKEHASAALIASARGGAAEARAEAELALVAAERLTSEFAHHPQASKTGLVGHRYADLRDRLTVPARDVR